MGIRLQAHSSVRSGLVIAAVEVAGSRAEEGRWLMRTVGHVPFLTVMRHVLRLSFRREHVHRPVDCECERVVWLIAQANAIGDDIAAGAITFGLLQQILTAFNQVSNSFQFLVNSWTTIVELMSIHKRLRAFEHNIWEYEASGGTPNPLPAE